jgi:hypothetical protein
MRLLGRADLKALLDTPEDASVSMFLPTQRTGDVVQGAIRLKNLLREAEEKLQVMGLRQPDADHLLDKGRALIDDTLFWHHQADGLAVFLAKDTFTYFRLPYHPDEMVVVANRFHVGPLLPLFAADGIFYVLALSQNKVGLVQCTRDGAREVTPDALPSSMADILQNRDFSRNIQFHSGPSQGAKGKGSAMYHGHGEGKDGEKDIIVRFLREVDHGLHETLKNEQAPLVLAGVGSLQALFREVNTYTHLLEEGVDGNPDQMSPADLQSRAWPLVETQFARGREAALARFGEGTARGLTMSRLEDVLLAAHDGRIVVLFVAVGNHVWGQSSMQERHIEIHGDYQPGDEDLVDTAVERALLTGAAVHVVPPEEVPGGEQVAALLRF